MAETAQPLQPAENHPSPGRGYTKKPHEKAKSSGDFNFYGHIILKWLADNEKGGRGVPCVWRTQGTKEKATKRVNSVSL
jgi:hypothetical protein